VLFDDKAWLNNYAEYGPSARAALGVLVAKGDWGWWHGRTSSILRQALLSANHYVFAPGFCNPAAGWEKGQVEKNVQDARPRLWQQMPDFPNLMALNEWLEQHC